MCPKNTSITPLDDDDFRLWTIFDHTQFMISRSREIELNKHKLTREQAYVLFILGRSNGSTTINEIAAITQRQHHSISTLINRMVKQGIVSKVMRASAKGKYDIHITEHGRDVYKQVRFDSVKNTFACLSEKEKQELDRHLRHLLTCAYALQGKQIDAKFYQSSFRAPVERSRKPPIESVRLK
jgi:DNA-binding MarR family transcriptional regulator